jgi:uncharacterized repeat protein (TIGR03943 family)
MTRLRALPALVLALLGVFLLNKVWSGTLFRYLHPRFLPLLVIAALGLLGMGQAFLRSGDHEPERQSAIQPPSQNGLPLLLPLIIGLLVAFQPLQSVAVEGRHLQFQGIPPPDGAAPAEEIAAELNVLEWLRLYDSAQNVHVYDGVAADLRGTVQHDPRLGKDQFFLVMYVMSCCISDASPVAVMVEWPGADTLAENEWVDVEGVMSDTSFDGAVIPMIIAAELHAIPSLDPPFLFN